MGRGDPDRPRRTDDKLVCSDRPLDPAERRRVLRFFHFYARCKGGCKDSHFNRASLIVVASVARVNRRFAVATGCSEHLSPHYRGG